MLYCIYVLEYVGTLGIVRYRYRYSAVDLRYLSTRTRNSNGIVVVLYRGFVRKADPVHILKYFSRHYQIAVKIKPLYLTNNTHYLTSNTTRVVQQ